MNDSSFSKFSQLSTPSTLLAGNKDYHTIGLPS